MDEAIEYLKEVNINDYVSVHILYYDITGYPHLEQSVNKVDYSPANRCIFPTSSLKWYTAQGEGTIYISSAYINPMDGVNSVSFCSLLTIRDKHGGRAKAILVKTIPVEILHAQWIFPGAYREAQVSLLDINGQYIIQSDSMGGYILDLHQTTTQRPVLR